MKKILIILIVILFLGACSTPVLEKGTYEVVDTTQVARNGFNTILYYEVIVKYDSAFYFGTLSLKGELTSKHHEKIDLSIFE